MKLLTSQKNKIYNYIISKHFFSPNQFKLEEEKNKITSIKYLNSPYYFNFIEDNEHVGFYVNYSPGKDRFLEATSNINWELGFQHLVSWLMNLQRELEIPDLWQRFEIEISGIQLSSNFDNTKFSISEYEIITQRINSISQGILSIPLLEQQQNEILINLQRLNQFAKELNRFDWKNLFIGTIISIIIQLNVTPENASDLWKLIKNIFNDYFLK